MCAEKLPALPPLPAPPPAEALFRVEGVSKIYTMGEVQVFALKEVSLEIYPREFLVILGASGSGKSTLLNLLGGMDSVSEGTIRFRDQLLSGFSEKQLTRYRRLHIGFVFQFYNLIPSLTARENVELVAEIARDPMRPEDALAMVGLSHRQDHFPAQLSGGEQQRVAVARAIVKRPDALLCDEPTGALDVETGKLVLSAIDRANREIGSTTVVITHNAAIAGMAHRVLRMGGGRIVSVEVNRQRLAPEDLVW